MWEPVGSQVSKGADIWYKVGMGEGAGILMSQNPGNFQSIRMQQVILITVYEADGHGYQ